LYFIRPEIRSENQKKYFMLLQVGTRTASEVWLVNPQTTASAVGSVTHHQSSKHGEARTAPPPAKSWPPRTVDKRGLVRTVRLDIDSDQPFYLYFSKCLGSRQCASMKSCLKKQQLG
jgi:hypothetical protein